MKDLNLTEKDKTPTDKPEKEKKIKQMKDDDDGLGFGSAFEQFGTYNGKAIGNDDGPRTSISHVNA